MGKRTKLSRRTLSETNSTDEQAVDQLHDLIPSSMTGFSTTTLSDAGATVRSENVYLDDLIRYSKVNLTLPTNLRKKSQLYRRRSSSFSYSSTASFMMSHICFILRMRPRMVCVFVAMFVVLVIGPAIPHIRHNQNHHFLAGKVSSEKDIQSVHDFSLANIDHWCFLPSQNGDCRCEDPLRPVDRAEFKEWLHQHHSFLAFSEAKVDVAFVGGSAVEEWSRNADASEYFQQHFNNTKLTALAFGIDGDMSPNVLWRLRHGEMNVETKLWWLILGTEDMQLRECSEEVVVLGIQRVVEEIRSKQQNVHIVVNSLLPLADYNLSDEQNRTLNSKEFNEDGHRRIKNKIKSQAVKTNTSEEAVLWPSVAWVNEELKRFCDNSIGTTFFDATDLFVDLHKGNRLLKQDLISGSGHPTKRGHLVWQEGILEMVESLFTSNN